MLLKESYSQLRSLTSKLKNTSRYSLFFVSLKNILSMKIYIYIYIYICIKLGIYAKTT